MVCLLTFPKVARNCHASPASCLIVTWKRACLSREQFFLGKHKIRNQTSHLTDELSFSMPGGSKLHLCNQCMRQWSEVLETMETLSVRVYAG